ncbi:MAG: hypothetical protein CVT49_00110 [candidate division Zixibacteria bacterium HGW-Zixibacteria-1]|nr:MAG: hypothetical protein CVT49_00110 [candidate division Zixibacteria bacterium HGW-Zixibacteria-1]
MRNKIYLCILPLMLAIVAAPQLYGQIIYDQPGSGQARMIYSHWKIKGDSAEIKVNQLAMPVTGFVPLQDNLEAQFYMANASNKLSVIDSDTTLAGFSDFRVQVNKSLYEDQLLLSGGINLPIGKKKLDPDADRAIIDVLSTNYLSFPIRRYGEGFGFNALIGGATIKGNTRYGVGIMYQYNGSYDPYEGEGSYDPGDLVSFNISASQSFEKTAVSGDFIFSSFGSDKLDDVEVYDAGGQLDMRLRGVMTEKTYSLGGYVRYLHRFKPLEFDIFSGISEEARFYGNEFSINGNFNYHPDKKWYVSPSIDMRLIGKNDQGFDKSTIFGIGGMYGRKLGERMDLDVGLKYFTGSADDGALDLTGLQLTFGLAAIF